MEYKLVSRKNHKKDTIIKIDNLEIGGKNVIFIGGPCSIENEQMLDKNIENIIDDVDIIRAGAYKLRTSPYSFQGLHKEGLEILSLIKKKYHKPVISEITDISELPYFKDIDIIQVGTRNMYNYELLKELGKINKPILLKRAFSATIDEFLLAAEYIMSNGNPNVILCERGIRTFENSTRFTLDLGSVVLLKKLTHLPIIVDPSHASGNKDLVYNLSLAAIASNADGIMVEVNDDAKNALSDAKQAICSKTFKKIVNKGKIIKKII